VTTWTRETSEARLSELAPKIARSLGDGWRREHNTNPDVTHYIALTHGEHERIGLHVAYPYGRVEISGSLSHLRDAKDEAPYYRSEDNPKITATLSKSPEQIAADITRRVLPGYRVVLAAVLDRIAKANAHLSATAATAAKVAEAIGAEPGKDGLVDFYCSAAFPEDSGSAKCSGDRVALSLVDLNVTEACALLAKLKLCRGK
jgi:hypothetical protein